VLVWSALTAGAALVTSYGMLVVTRLGVGVGEAVCAPAGTSWIGDLFPVSKRSRALAFFMLAVPLGTALSYMVSGPVAQAFGWRASLVLARSEEHTSELQSQSNLVCRLLLEKKNKRLCSTGSTIWFILLGARTKRLCGFVHRRRLSRRGGRLIRPPRGQQRSASRSQRPPAPT